MAVTFGYYLREEGDPYVYTFQYDLEPIDILSIGPNQALSSQVAAVGDVPVITPIGISLREVTIRGKFSDGLSAQMPGSWISERTDEDYIKEGYILRVHEDPYFSAAELVNFPYSTSININNYPYKSDGSCPAYWTINTFTIDQRIQQQFGRYEFDIVLSYNWLYDGESLWRF